ncbi:hypothetical protein L3Y34_012474 [Caenorhabditis briggsae]|uniref:Uncharacterized protein n=1 Tax=Caenorhabditis briggsae TaxID=6238 RepID=A0AAE8ZSR5_CAEBR|nr:hypothetical protein L3Y34_012474 [Caenorhabditis briggsae]
MITRHAGKRKPINQPMNRNHPNVESLSSFIIMGPDDLLPVKTEEVFNEIAPSMSEETKPENLLPAHSRVLPHNTSLAHQAYPTEEKPAEIKMSGGEFSASTSNLIKEEDYEDSAEWFRRNDEKLMAYRRAQEAEFLAMNPVEGSIQPKRKETSIKKAPTPLKAATVKPTYNVVQKYLIMDRKKEYSTFQGPSSSTTKLYVAKPLRTRDSSEPVSSSEELFKDPPPLYYTKGHHSKYREQNKKRARKNELFHQSRGRNPTNIADVEGEYPVNPAHVPWNPPKGARKLSAYQARKTNEALAVNRREEISKKVPTPTRRNVPYQGPALLVGSNQKVSAASAAKMSKLKDVYQVNQEVDAIVDYGYGTMEDEMAYYDVQHEETPEYKYVPAADMNAYEEKPKTFDMDGLTAEVKEEEFLYNEPTSSGTASYNNASHQRHGMR